MKTRHKTAHKHDGKHEGQHEGKELIAGAADFHDERIRQEEEIEAKNETANRPEGNYEYQQLIAENTVFTPKQMIEEAAFYISEQRDFAPGKEVSDWLQAENDVEAMLVSAK